jgi:serine/threonine protein kinase
VLERELGRGGMATVYAAHDVRHDRRVALKVLHPELTASLGPEWFQREIHVTAQLQHPHILPVHDSGETEGRLWYVMPFVEGESLRQRLARDGELPVAETVRLLVEIVEALAYAHAQGVIHRDIQPDNILLSGRHALVADLGATEPAVLPARVRRAGCGAQVHRPGHVGPLGAPKTLLRIDPLPVAPSPDGRRLAFSTDKGLLVTGLRADSARNLFPVSYRAHTVRPTYVGWSTDSRTIYCLVLDSLDRASVVSIDPASAERKLLVRFDDDARDWHATDSGRSAAGCTSRSATGRAISGRRRSTRVADPGVARNQWEAVKRCHATLRSFGA